MQATRFDRLTRALTAQPSRRLLLRAVVTSAVAGIGDHLLMRRSTRADGGGTCASAGAWCDDDAACCSDWCDSGTCVEGECQVDTDCPGADVCQRAVCIPATCQDRSQCGPNQVCCAGTCQLGNSCCGDTDCTALGIYTVSVDGTNLIQFAPSAFYPAWSPDGSRLAYATFTSQGMGLFTAAPDGSDPVPLLDDLAIWALSPIWSPDGTLVAFSGADTTVVLIGVVGADGSGLQWTLPGDGSYPVAMAWSPDGTRLAYASETEQIATLWVVAADGTGALALTEVPGTIEALAWSPNGAQIALHVDDYRDVIGERSNQLLVIGSDGTGLTTLTSWEPDAAPGSDPFVFGTPNWSADGTQIAIGADGGIALVEADGSGLNLIALPDLTAYEIAWSPDGTLFAVSALNNNEEFDENVGGPGYSGTDLYVVNVDGTGLRVVAATPLEDITPAWSPDGLVLAFTAEPLGE